MPERVAKPSATPSRERVSMRAFYFKRGKARWENGGNRAVAV
jgi:hypothetical protein